MHNIKKFSKKGEGKASGFGYGYNNVYGKGRGAGEKGNDIKGFIAGKGYRQEINGSIVIYGMGNANN